MGRILHLAFFRGHLFIHINPTQGWPQSVRSLACHETQSSWIGPAHHREYTILSGAQLFQTSGGYYLQVQGTAMGASFLPCYANLTMGWWEESCIWRNPSLPESSFSSAISMTWLPYGMDLCHPLLHLLGIVTITIWAFNLHMYLIPWSYYF